MKVAIIFKERPIKWGYRGDPYLWEELEQAFHEVDLPCSPECFIEKMNGYIEELLGGRLEAKQEIRIERYDRGGISGGQISETFWKEVAMPLLLERLQVENSRF